MTDTDTDKLLEALEKIRSEVKDLQFRLARAESEVVNRRLENERLLSRLNENEGWNQVSDLQFRLSAAESELNVAHDAADFMAKERVTLESRLSAAEAEREEAIENAERWRRRCDERGNVYRRLKRAEAVVEAAKAVLEFWGGTDLVSQRVVNLREAVRRFGEGK